MGKKIRDVLPRFFLIFPSAVNPAWSSALCSWIIPRVFTRSRLSRTWFGHSGGGATQKEDADNRRWLPEMVCLIGARFPSFAGLGDVALTLDAASMGTPFKLLYWSCKFRVNCMAGACSQLGLS